MIPCVDYAQLYKTLCIVEQGSSRFDAAIRQPGLTPEARIPNLISALAKDECIILVESYEEVAWDESICNLLRQAEEHLSGAKIIVTSQQAPAWEIEHRRIYLSGLEGEASRQVLASLGVSDGWEKIYKAVDGCPKALHLTARIVKAYGLEEAIRWAQRGESALFGEVYRRLSEPARRMWTMLAMLPGPFDRERVLAIWDTANGTSTWADLVDASVLDRRGDRWQLHSLARATGSLVRPGERQWRKNLGR